MALDSAQFIDIEIHIGPFPWQSKVKVGNQVMAGVKRILVDTEAVADSTIITLEVYPDSNTPTVLRLSGKLLLDDDSREGLAGLVTGSVAV